MLEIKPILRGSFSLVVLSAAFTVNAADFSLVQDWQTPTSWPVDYQYTAIGDVPELLIIEESGINLSLIDSAGNKTSTPGNNTHGPEFLLIPKGKELKFNIDQAYGNSPAGSFRIYRLPLENETLMLAAQKLVEAGFAVQSGEKARLEIACADYYDIAQISEIPSQIREASAMLSVECNRLEGKASPIELVNALYTKNYPLGFKAYHADWFRGRLAFSNENYPKAREYFDLALSLAKTDLENNKGLTFGLELDIASIYVNKASVEMIQAYQDGSEEGMLMLDQAEIFLTIALKEAEAKGDHAIKGNAYRFKSAVALVRGDGQERIKNLLLARDEIRFSDDLIPLMHILGSIGDYYKEWGDLQLAQESYLEALSIVKETQSEDRTADPFHNMSTFYYTLGDFPRAKEMILHTRQVYMNLGNVVRTNMMNFDLATILIEQGQLQQAHKLLEELLPFLKERPAPWDPVRIETQSALARLEGQLGRPETALRYSSEIDKHLKQERKAMSGFEIVPVFVTHAKLLAENNQFEQALSVLENTLNTLAIEPAAQIEVLAGMHDIYSALGDTTSAIAVADKSFLLIESQQMELESVRLGPYWNGKMQEVYMAHVDYLLSMTVQEERFRQRAFDVVERARASSLRLRRQEMLLARTRKDNDAYADWQEIMESIQQSSGIQNSEEESLKLERKISEARERYFVKYADSSLRLKPELTNLEQLKQSLENETLVLEYVAGPENIWRFDIDAEGWNITNIGPTEMVSASVDAALFELSSGSNSGNRNINYLSSLLLKGLEINDDISKLLISPSGSMNSIPFSALSYKTAYLMDHASVTLLPSISEYFNSTSERASSEGSLSLAVFADPMFGTQAPALDLAFVDTEKMRAWSDSLERLPATALEAKALRKFYDDKNSLVLTGKEATQEKFFNDKVRNADIIHIATHGYFNEQLPELIGFALASENEFDDGFVSMAEISSQQFNANLVVISACSTARGEIIPGEGSMSLARTFLAQGVNSVVSTLWPVSDRATAIFMNEFYRALNEENMPYDQALKSAQQKLRRHNSYSSPFYWGAYILSSAGRGS